MDYPHCTGISKESKIPLKYIWGKNYFTEVLFYEHLFENIYSLHKLPWKPYRQLHVVIFVIS